MKVGTWTVEQNSCDLKNRATRRSTIDRGGIVARISLFDALAMPPTSNSGPIGAGTSTFSEACAFSASSSESLRPAIYNAKLSASFDNTANGRPPGRLHYLRWPTNELHQHNSDAHHLYRFSPVNPDLSLGHPQRYHAVRHYLLVVESEYLSAHHGVASQLSYA